MAGHQYRKVGRAPSEIKSGSALADHVRRTKRISAARLVYPPMPTVYIASSEFSLHCSTRIRFVWACKEDSQGHLEGMLRTTGAHNLLSRKN